MVSEDLQKLCGGTCPSSLPPLVPLPRHEELDSFFFWAVKDIVPEFTKDRLCT